MPADETAPVQRRRRRKKIGCCRAVFLPWLKRKLCTWNLFTQYLLYFVGMWLYLLVGGLVFWLVEHANEEEELENAVEERNRFTAELANDLNQTYEETEAFIDYISTLCDQDVFIGDLDTIPRKWEYGPSVFFAMTVITTIGQCLIYDDFTYHFVHCRVWKLSTGYYCRPNTLLCLCIVWNTVVSVLHGVTWWCAFQCVG